jgi:hypothetical protein
MSWHCCHHQLESFLFHLLCASRYAFSAFTVISGVNLFTCHKIWSNCLHKHCIMKILILRQLLFHLCQIEILKISLLWLQFFSAVRLKRNSVRTGMFWSLICQASSK